MAGGRRKQQVVPSGASVQPGSRPPRFRFPSPPAPLAAAIVGAVSGLLAVLLVLLAERGCDMARGRPSCGGVGLVMLVAIIVACLVLGALLMRLLHVRDPGLVAFFGVSLAVIFIMLFLIDQVFSGWMLLVIPLLAAATFAVSALLTQALENSGEPTYDAHPYTRTDADIQAAEEHRDVPARQDVADLPRYAPMEDPASSSGAPAISDDAPLLSASRGAASTMRPRHAAPVASRPEEVEIPVDPDAPPTRGRHGAS